MKSQFRKYNQALTTGRALLILLAVLSSTTLALPIPYRQLLDSLSNPHLESFILVQDPPSVWSLSPPQPQPGGDIEPTDKPTLQSIRAHGIHAKVTYEVEPSVERPTSWYSIEKDGGKTREVTVQHISNEPLPDYSTSTTYDDDRKSHTTEYFNSLDVDVLPNAWET